MGITKGRWHNQHGTEIEIEVDTDGYLRGTLQLAGTYRGESLPLFPLRGYARGDVISFVVDFGRLGSITAWTGRLVKTDDGRAEIDTLWHMAIAGPADDASRWRSQWTGADRFRPGPAPGETAQQAPPQLVFWE
jgi:hypothetical protein